ncbi:MAG: hypothetical protein ACREPL_13545 [Rhodanobacteraceae bacterium]
MPADIAQTLPEFHPLHLSMQRVNRGLHFLNAFAIVVAVFTMAGLPSIASSTRCNRG